MNILVRSMLYFDWAAGAPADADIWDESAAVARSCYANPSSSHSIGLLARDRVEEARKRIASTLRRKEAEVVFTSGATEANNLVVSSLLNREQGGSIVVSGIEHASVYESCRALADFGFTVLVVDPDRLGRLDPSLVANAIRADTVLVALMHVNNETGAIQPIDQIIKAVRSSKISKRRIHIHTDLVQAFGRIPVDVEHLDFDSAVISGHKLSAPRGAGVLITRNWLRSILYGGGQEQSMRPGTENLFAIWGTMLAVERATDRIIDSNPEGRTLFAKIARDITGGIIIHGEESLDSTRYSPFIASLSFPPLPAEVLVRSSSDRGLHISTGSACNTRTGANGEHRVLRSMGYTEETAKSAVRISWAPETTHTQLEQAADMLSETTRNLLSRIRR